MKVTTMVAICFALTACSVQPAPSRASTARAHGTAIGGDGIVTFRMTTSRGTITVDPNGVLLLDDGHTTRVLDRDVIAEVSVALDGALLAYPRRTDLGTALMVRELHGQPVVVSEGLSVADRPALSPDGALVAFWGSGGQDTTVGMYVRAVNGEQAPRRVNNIGVMVGEPGFVEPPIERSFVFDGPRTVVWRGIDGEHRAEVQ
jgi:hypothetical protein